MQEQDLKIQEAHHENIVPHPCVLAAKSSPGHESRGARCRVACYSQTGRAAQLQGKQPFKGERAAWEDRTSGVQGPCTLKARSPRGLHLG